MKLLAMNYSQFETTVYGIFIMFVTRANKLTYAQAVEEANRMEDNRLDLLATPTERLNHYIRMSRIGGSFALTRVKRKELLLSLENAINHASFEDGMLYEKELAA
jgi:hypothetical protein